MYKYLERRKAKQIARLEAEFDKAYKQFMREEKMYDNYIK